MLNPRTLFRIRSLALATLLATTAAPRAQATLGENEKSIDNVSRVTRTALRSRTERTVGNAMFTVHELGDRGTTIREYVRADGTVFAVTYLGFRSPDSAALLGKYNGEFKRLMHGKRTPGLRSRFGQSNTLIAIRGGHPRALRGRFIAPNLLPEGVKPNDIR